ncbi:MAG TPA: nucleotide sugar dehydrogenase, partial [Candidatus Thermoplasmatota archaeon]|nr:nucleotide sugar dehydrogenase [Candidatus Thermoplasmatota archaeon]
MKVVVVGAGYVGVCTGIALAELGHDVRFADVDAAKVDALRRHVAPFREPGVDEALARLAIPATVDVAGAVRGADVVILCVGTPSTREGEVDLGALEAASRAVGEALAGRSDFPVVAVKSTVLPGTTRSVVAPIVAGGSGLVPGTTVGVGSNPEFLAEGTALRDARAPDRIVVGADDPRTAERLLALYAKLDRPKVAVSTETAELAKYASNAFLAARVALADEVANLARAVGGDSVEVLRLVGLDARIGPHYLRAGAGFGGSCFPKDLSALSGELKRRGLPAHVVDALLAHNDRQPVEVVRIVEAGLGGLRGRRVAILGLAFKAGTDDVRESRAFPIARELLARGATVIAYDPLATRAFLDFAPHVDGAPTAAAA